MVRYADDLVVLCRWRPPEHDLPRLRQFLARLRVTVNEDKSRVVEARQVFDFLGVHFRKQPTRRDARRSFSTAPDHPSGTAAPRARFGRGGALLHCHRRQSHRRAGASDRRFANQPDSARYIHTLAVFPGHAWGETRALYAGPQGTDQSRMTVHHQWPALRRNLGHVPAARVAVVTVLLVLWSQPFLALHETHHALERGEPHCPVAQIAHLAGAACVSALPVLPAPRVVAAETAVLYHAPQLVPFRAPTARAPPLPYPSHK